MADLDDLVHDNDKTRSAPVWITTFSHRVALLLTIVVLIVAMSEVEVKKFQPARGYFQDRADVPQYGAIVPPGQLQTIARFGSVEQAQRYAQLLKHLRKEDLQEKVQVNMTEQGLHVVITDSIMFRSGEALLIEPARTILRMIAEVLLDEVESVVVEGHTDNRPIETSSFLSNWELSSGRASCVVRFLLDQTSALDPERYVAIGYGDHQPKRSNDTADGRARNRRVEILFSWEPWQNPLNASMKQPRQQTAL